MRVLNDIFPDGIKIPEYFIGKNIVHLPTDNNIIILYHFELDFPID